MTIERYLSGLNAGARPPVPAGPYLVVGLGEAGSAATTVLCDRAIGEVLAFDRNSATVPKRVRRALEAAGARVLIGSEERLLDLSPRPRTIIKSPGVPIDAPVLTEARRRGLEVIDELELGWRLARAPFIAVTGTKGKTTTAALISAVLQRSGLGARLAGNADFAPPLSSLDGDPDVVVCEASSFQLEGCPALAPEVAVFTNLSRDHLSRHGSMRRYGEIKRSLFVRNGVAVQTAVVDTSDSFGRELAVEVERLGSRTIRVGFDPGVDYRIVASRWDLRKAELELSTPSGPLVLESRLPGVYNARNIAAAVAVVDQVGVGRDLLAEALGAHPGAPGRFEHLDFGQEPDLILDMASIPAAVDGFLAAVRAGMEPGGRLHAVIGILGNPERSQCKGPVRLRDSRSRGAASPPDH